MSNSLQSPDPEKVFRGDDGTFKGAPSNDHVVGPSALEWDSPADRDNPKNWRMRQRVPIAGVIIVIGFLAGFISSASVPGTPGTQAEFHVQNKIIATLPTSLYVLGFGLGPYVLAPLSELYGRKIVYQATLSSFTLIQIGCALSPSMPALIILRLIAGCFGSIAPSLGPASMSDLFAAHERGISNSLLSIGVLTGPPMGTVIGSFVVSAKPWPWIYWLTTAFSGIVLIANVLFFKETYEPYILRQRFRRRSQRANLPSSVPGTQDVTTLFLRAITRPLRFMYTSLVVMILGTFQAYSFAMLYLILVSLPLLFGSDRQVSDANNLFTYKFTPIQEGLSYLGLVIGFILGGTFQMRAQTFIYRTLTEKNGVGRPEYRLLPMTISAVFFPIGLLWYGWSAEAHRHWILPEIGLVIFAFGVFINFQSVQLYVAEAFIPFSASALAAITLLRCIAGAAFPLFGQAMFIKLGYGWASTVLAMLFIPAVPVPWILYRVGEHLRNRFPFKP
ncbi:MFS general substrate transporter [Sistotremastrum suecicum HHB10207 ss-3]|uniref:MFS general substrate transporter n=1 Tax=Sistotremastrum suecicum HHB10207 ss-3 TaxID=1314776 RepID=A0A166B356_9AGAM|nr:MFS general substrate transporter [Sistotremastrum suecicum HHB10207 ss-3]